MNIKPTVLHNIALLGIVAALLLLPFNATACGITLAINGVFAMLLADYGRNVEPLTVPTRVVPFGEPERPAPELRDAA
jgi:hypothetical protein